MIPDGEAGCKICNKSIYRIFVEHIENHDEVSEHLTIEELDERTKRRKVHK